MDNGADQRRSELVYQTHRAAEIEDVAPTPEWVIDRYRRHRLWRLFPKELMFKALGDMARTQILDFGCGEGQLSTQLARLGAHVTAIDISPELVAIAKKRAALDGVQDRIEFMVGDIANVPLRPNAFDVVVASAVLHHVDLRVVLPQLLVHLKPGGAAMLIEPIAFCPSLQKFRDRLPLEKDVSPDERQLSREDVKFIRARLVDPRVTFFNIFGRLARLFPNANRIDRGHPITKASLVLLLALDRLLLTLVPGLSRFAGTILVVGRKPRAAVTVDVAASLAGNGRTAR